MRGGFAVQLIGNRGGPPSALGDWLRDHGYALTTLALEDPPVVASEAPLVRLVQVGPTTALDRLAAHLRQRPGLSMSTAAVVTGDHSVSLARATAIGCDDALALPTPDALIAHQLDRLHELAAMRRELALRRDACADLGRRLHATAPASFGRSLSVLAADSPQAADPAAASASTADATVTAAGAEKDTSMSGAAPAWFRRRAQRQSPATDPAGATRRLADVARTRVLLVGPPAQAKVRLAEALGNARLAFAETVAHAGRMIEGERIELVILCLTDRRAMSDAHRWHTPAGHSAPCAVALLGAEILDAPPRDMVEMLAWARAHKIEDVLTMDSSVEQLRMRLDHWKDICAGRRQLNAYAERMLPPEALDTATGLVTLDYLAAYAMARRALAPQQSIAAVLLRCDNLWEIGQAVGYTAAVRLMAEIGGFIREAVRMTDLVAYCGSGEFMAVVETAQGEQLPRIAARVEDAVADRLSDVTGIAPRLTTSHLLVDPMHDLANSLRAALAARDSGRSPTARPPGEIMPTTGPTTTPAAEAHERQRLEELSFA